MLSCHPVRRTTAARISSLPFCIFFAVASRCACCQSAPSGPVAGTASADLASHAHLTPIQTQLASALGKFPPDRDAALPLVRQLKGNLNFPIKEPCGDTPLTFAVDWGDLEMLQA